MVIPLAITAIFSIIFFVYPNMFYIFDLAKWLQEISSEAYEDEISEFYFIGIP